MLNFYETGRHFSILYSPQPEPPPVSLNDITDRATLGGARGVRTRATLVSRCYLEKKVGGLRAFLRLADAATPRAAKGIGNAKTKLDFADVRIYKDEFINPLRCRDPR